MPIVRDLKCVSDIHEVHGNLSNQLFKMQVCGRNRAKEVDEYINSIPFNTK